MSICYLIFYEDQEIEWILGLYLIVMLGKDLESHYQSACQW